MRRNSCNGKQKMRKGLWSPEEDEKLYNYIKRFGVGCWSSVPKLAGLQRCGKSCRLRWINYLRPDLKRGMFSLEEEVLIISLHEALGNRWAQIATQLPGRTDNEIKNFWNSSLKKKLLRQGIDPNTHKPLSEAEVVSDEKGIPQPKGLPNLANSIPMEHPNMISSNGNNGNNQAYDDTCAILPNGSFLSHFYNPISGFGSMPDLTSFDHQNMIDTEYYSDNSSSRLNKYLLSEGKESSSNTSNLNMVTMMTGNAHENTWDVDSMFQFQYHGNDPLSREFDGVNMDLFQQI